jgi:hypothetical protein
MLLNVCSICDDVVFSGVNRRSIGVMVDTRESRASATEQKFVLDAATGSRVREWARARLQADPYGSGPFGDEYLTSSLYFDTNRLDVFHRRGSFGRAKFRIRRYSGADYVFLERKLRRPNLLVKRRTRVGLETVSMLAGGSLAPSTPGHWFADRLRVRQLAPTCLLSYHRTARGIDTPRGLARLTVDDQIRVVQADDFSLPEAGIVGGQTMLDGEVIVELKFRGLLPDIFQELIRTFALQGRTASKYRVGMMTLGHELTTFDPLEPSEFSAVIK